jgi:hypothetical protein
MIRRKNIDAYPREGMAGAIGYRSTLDLKAPAL